MAPKVTTESVQAMCAAYGDIDSSVVSRAISILGTVNKLCDGVRRSHAGDLEAHADALVLDDAHLDETRFFLLSCGTTGETLRLDVLKVVSATNDPRIAPKPADVAPPPTQSEIPLEKEARRRRRSPLLQFFRPHASASGSGPAGPWASVPHHGPDPDLRGRGE